MNRKLVCALVDDDVKTHEIFKNFMKDSPFAVLGYFFHTANDFLKIESSIKYDVCLLDIMLPDMLGFEVAEKITKPYIFISGFKDKLIESIELVGPLDVVSKPTKKERLDKAIELAYNKIIRFSESKKKQYYELFHVAHKRGVINIFIPDIYYIKTDDSDHRNKNVIFKNGESLTLMNCNFNIFLECSPKLGRVNKSEMISFEIFEGIEFDLINIKKIDGLKLPTWVTISSKYKADFLARYHTIP